MTAWAELSATSADQVRCKDRADSRTHPVLIGLIQAAPSNVMLTDMAISC